MIVKQVAGGAKTAGLLAYLYGPGVGEARGGTVHVNPRTVASWDGQPSVHPPRQLDNVRRSVGDVAQRLDAPVALVTKAPAKHVGHIVLRTIPTTRSSPTRSVGRSPPTRCAAQVCRKGRPTVQTQCAGGA